MEGKVHQTLPQSIMVDMEILTLMAVHPPGVVNDHRVQVIVDLYRTAVHNMDTSWDNQSRAELRQ